MAGKVKSTISSVCLKYFSSAKGFTFSFILKTGTFMSESLGAELKFQF